MSGRGRPSLYTEEIAEEICERMVQGESLRIICERDGMPAESTIFKWLLKAQHPEFVEKYAHAREVQAHQMFEETREIVDSEPDPVRARVRFDQRRWAAGQLLPKVYGPRMEIDANVRTSVITAEPLSEDEWQAQHTKAKE